MNDEALAQAVYKRLGRGTPSKHRAGHHSWNVYTWGLDAAKYVRDWRVAGALMEKCRSLDYDHDLDDNDYTVSVWTSSSFTGPSATMDNESLPRAIIEACVEALT